MKGEPREKAFGDSQVWEVLDPVTELPAVGAVASLNCCFLTCRKEKTLPTIFYFFHLSSPGPLPAAAAVNVTALAQTTGMVRDSQPVYSYLQKTRRTSIALEGFLVLFCFHFCFFVKRTCYLFNEQFLSIYCV